MNERMLSVVAPTRDRGDISECLEHLLRLEYRPIEFLVVDQSSGSATRESVEAVNARAPADSPAFRYIHSERKGLDVARNIGLVQANGEWIAFVDDDCLVEGAWAAALVQAYDANPLAGMVFGRTLPFYKPETGKRTEISIKNLSHPQVFSSRVSLVNRSAGMGGNMSLSRQCYETVGPFDELLGVGTDLPGGDELEMMLRAVRSGFHVHYTPDAVCLHKRRLSEEDYLRTQNGYYTGRAAAWVKHSVCYSRWATFALPAEFGRRWVEIPYHAFVTWNGSNVRRAWVRMVGYSQGMTRAWKKPWTADPAPSTLSTIADSSSSRKA